MPSPSDNLRTGKAHDGRRKLADDEREDIKKLYNAGESIRAIARLFPHVSRRLVQFVLFPERYAVVLKRAKDEKRWFWYYHKDTHTQAMRKHRAKIKSIYHL